LKDYLENKEHGFILRTLYGPQRCKIAEGRIQSVGSIEAVDGLF